MDKNRKETRQKRSSVGRTLHYYGKATLRHWPFFLLGIGVTLGYTFFLSFANPLVVARIVDRVSAGNVAKGQILPVFGPSILLLILANVAGQICSKAQDYAAWKLQILVNYDLSQTVFDTLSNQSMSFHNSRFGGALVSSTSKFLNGYSTLIETFIFAMIPIASSAVFSIALPAPLVPLYAVALVILMAIYILVVYILFRRLLHMNSQAAGAQNRLSGELSDSITNILAVKTSGRESYEKKLFDEANREVRRVDSKRMRSSIASGSVAAGIIVVIMAVLTVFITGGNAWFGISAGTLVMMFTYTNSLCMQFNRINSTMQAVNRAFGDAHEMTEILDEPTLVEDAPGAEDLNVTEGRIEFRDLDFWYDDAAVTTPEVFHDFNLTIPAGERIGLVGKSGSGKTTLTRLLLRLADIQQGQILVDGQDISKVTQVSLRRQIAYVPQEPLLFHRTVAENIAYGKPDATMEEIRSAAERANALEFIEQLPQGFETITGERGVKLSGGQRQRVAIARAILTDAPILVLDEATSALDSESERLIQDALLNLMQGRTSLVIAHRLSTVASLDRIIVLRDGRIVEDGTHHELIEAGGEYAGLWERQSGAFLENEE